MSTVNLVELGLNAGIPFGGMVVGFILAMIFWLYTIVVVANEKTEDPFDRIAWLLVVLLLPVVGAVLCLCFAKTSPHPSRSSQSRNPEEEIKRRANEGTLL